MDKGFKPDFFKENSIISQQPHASQHETVYIILEMC